MGCTEPIAIAYAASVARHALGEMPQRVEIGLSGTDREIIRMMLQTHG